jgi:hypothetical protein
MRPGRPLLAMNIPIGVGDRLDCEKAVVASFLEQRRDAREQAISPNSAIDHDMGNMNAKRTIFPGHALRDHPQAGLGCGKMGKARPAAQTRGSAGKDNGALAERNQSSRGLAPNQKATEATDPPELLELSALT